MSFYGKSGLISKQQQQSKSDSTEFLIDSNSGWAVSRTLQLVLREHYREDR